MGVLLLGAGESGLAGLTLESLLGLATAFDLGGVFALCVATAAALGAVRSFAAASELPTLAEVASDFDAVGGTESHGGFIVAGTRLLGRAGIAG